MQSFLVMAAVLMLAACQLSRPGGGETAAAANPVTGDAIEVTSLDAPVEGLAEAEAAVPDAAEAPEEAAEADAAADDAVPDETAVEAVPEVVTEPPVNPALQTPEALACLKEGGQYRTVGNEIVRACVTPTRDGGDRCETGRDCDGECLARSGTCAPFTPLFGCNDVLQDNGQRVTLCLN